MKYKNLKLFWKLTTNYFYERINKKDLSILFYKQIFDKKFFLNFMKNKYFERFSFTAQEKKMILSELDFLVKKLDYINNIKVLENKFIWADLIFCYSIFNKILSYYNNYYKWEWNINLSKWVYLRFEVFDLEQDIDKHYNSEIFKDLLLPIIENIETEDNLVSMEVFWPHELVFTFLIWKYLKENRKDSRLVINFSRANEQFDFSNWDETFKKVWNKVFDYIDYIVFFRDYWESIWKLMRYYNKKNINLEDISNLMYLKNGEIIFKRDVETKDNAKLLDVFIKNSLNTNNIHDKFWKKSIVARLLPYKCFYNKCSFCVINGQNIYKYDKNYTYFDFVDKWIDFIKDSGVEDLNFMDEAIPPVVLVYLAKKIVENDLSINYQIRTRFSKEFLKKENVSLFFKSWMRYCWVWLESASDRVNKDIANKWVDDLSIKDKLTVIHLFDRAWISFHNYSIMWFPTETKQESLFTMKFLVNNIVKSNHFTSTPNIFHLMKRSGIYKDREKLGIEIIDEDDSKLNFDFLDNWKKRDYNFLTTLVEQVHISQFMPWLSVNNRPYDISEFWDFVDRTWFFYFIKRYYKKNPYHTFWKINSSVKWLDYEEIKNKKFSLSNYIQVFENNTENIDIYDWVLSKQISIPEMYKDFLNNYDNQKTLEENTKKYNISQKEDILYLIDSKVLLLS